MDSSYDDFATINNMALRFKLFQYDASIPSKAVNFTIYVEFPVIFQIQEVN